MTTLAEEIAAANEALRRAAEGGYAFDPSLMQPGADLADIEQGGQVVHGSPGPQGLPALPTPPINPTVPVSTDFQAPEQGSGHQVVSNELGYTQIGDQVVRWGDPIAAPRTGNQGPPGANIILRPPPVGQDQIVQGYMQQAEGAVGTGILQGQQALQEAAVFDEQAEQERAVAEHFAQVSGEHEQRARGEIQRLASLLDEMAANRIDPNRMFSGPGGGSARLGAAVATAGGFISSVYTQQPNAALDIINRAIDRDLQAQVANQGQQRAVLQGRLSLIDAMRNAYKDETSALLAARAIRLQEASNRLRALQARTSSAATASNLQQVLGRIQAQMLQHLNDLEMNQWQIGMTADARMVPSFIQASTEERVRNRRLQVAQRAADTITEQQLQQELGPQMAPETSPQTPVQEPLGATQAPVQGVPARGVAAPSRNRLRAAPGGLPADPSRVAQFGVGSEAPLPPGYRYGPTMRGRDGRPWATIYDSSGRPDLAMTSRLHGVELDIPNEAQVRAVREDLGAVPEGTLPVGTRYTTGGEYLWNEYRRSAQGELFGRMMADWPRFVQNSGRLLNEMETSYSDATPNARRMAAHVRRLTRYAQLLQKLGAADAEQISEQAASIQAIVGGDPGQLATETGKDLLEEFVTDAAASLEGWARFRGLQWDSGLDSWSAVRRVADEERARRERERAAPTEAPTTQSEVDQNLGEAFQRMGGRRY